MATKSIFKNIIYKFILEIFRMIIPIISIPYVYRKFNPDIMGNIEFSQSIANYFFIFAGFGVYVYGLREISRVRNDKDKRNKLFTELFLISTISSILITLIYLFYVYFHFNEDYLLRNMLLLNSIQIISYIFYIEWINEAFENYQFISRKTMIVKLVNLICIFIFIKVGTDYYKYLFLINIFIFINNVISFIYINKYIKLEFKNIELKKYFVPLGTVVLISNINILYVQLDKILLGFYCENIDEVAYYSVAHKVSAMLMTIIMSLVTVVIPRLSFYLGQGNQEEFKKMFNNIFSLVSIILFPICVGMMVLSKEIVLFFGGQEYLKAQSVMVAFGFRLLIAIILSILINNVIFLHKKEKVIALISIFCGCINVIFKYLLIRSKCFTANSAICTTMIAEILVIILGYIYVRKYLKLELNIFKTCYLKYLLYSLSFLLIKYCIRQNNLNYITYSIVIFICCSIAYFFLLVLSKDQNLYVILERIKLNKVFRR